MAIATKWKKVGQSESNTIESDYHISRQCPILDCQLSRKLPHTPLILLTLYPENVIKNMTQVIMGGADRNTADLCAKFDMVSFKINFREIKHIY